MGLFKKLRKNRKAISPTIVAIIVIVAVVIGVSITVAGWMMRQSPPRVEALRIAQGSGIVAANKEFILVLENTGTADASIINIKVGGADAASLNSPVTKYPIPVNAGTKVTVRGIAGFPGVCGTTGYYEALVYTAAGNSYTTILYVL